MSDPTLYFDCNATTPVAPDVWQRMEPFLKEHYGNPSSLHHLSRVPARALREARRQVAELLGASTEREVIFTSCGSESNNTAIRSALASRPDKKQIITSSVEHSAVRKLCRHLAGQGYEVHEIGVSQQGFLNIDELKRRLSPATAVVSLMLANNETGVLFPIEEIGQIVKEKGALFHVDAVQAAGKYPLDMKNSCVDFLSVSAHKIYGPKGVGALYMRSGTPYENLLIGGSQERGRRAGTENVAGIAGLGAACELAVKDLPGEMERLKALRSLFEDSLMEVIPALEVNGNRHRRLPTTSNLCFPGIDGEAFMMALDQRGLCASSGSACMSGSAEPSHVLKAMGLSDDDANASLRFSFGRFTTREDIEAGVEIIKETYFSFRNSTRESGSIESADDNRKAAL